MSYLKKIDRGMLAGLMLAVTCVPAPAQAFQGEVEIGGGLALNPQWEGSRKYKLDPLPMFRLHSLTIPGLISIGGRESGWSIAPSFRVVDSRKESDAASLAGLGTIDAAYELGGRISYRWDMLRALVELRRGFGGHEGVIGAFGFDVIWHPATRLEIEAGPRVTFAGQDYMQNYFGIDAVQASRSGYSRHAADAGIKSVGVKAKATYRLNDLWAVVGQMGYDRLVGDAADSPIVRAGSADQFTIGAGVTYRLQWSR
ncbi:MAG TPA: MipA/OmpV family protein [Hyphomicrobiaceae bacterium]|nr:MipA/OmpV family protein [Hyphomicrobiaceae bacterium]